MYEVRAYGKLLICRAADTDSLAAYMRYVVPDEIYTDYYDGDPSDLSANCEDRVDYCGLEIYTMLDGAIIAAASYYEGRMLDRVFLGDPQFSRLELDRRLRYLLRGVFIRRSMLGMTRGEDFDFGGRECFYDSTGTLYYVKYINGDGYATMDFDNEYGGCKDGHIINRGGDSGDSSGSGSGGNTGGNTGGGNTGPGPGAGGPGPGGPGTGGPGAGVGGGGPGDSGSGDDDPKPELPPDSQDPKPQDPIGNKPRPWRPYPVKPIDPTPSDPIPPYIIPIPDPDDPDEPEEEKPCADSLNYEANPLLEMQISDDNKSWKSNTWGYVRRDRKGAKFHDGLDLKGIEGETLVYAMYSGVVTRCVSCQPNRISSTEYPDGYSGDMNAAGNRLTIRSTLPNGQTIEVSYWHLDVEDSNPYTKEFKEWKTNIARGQIIGVVGTSGNAYGGHPHLHVKVHVDGTHYEDETNNPFNYLYTKFSALDGNIIRDC